jgi:lipid kinase YegS
MKLPWLRASPSARGERVRIILHAKVAMSQSVRQAVAHFRKLGRDIEVRVTWEPGDAEFFAEEAARDHRFATVVAAGGDGSINAVVTGLMRSGEALLPALAVLPMGTANDFARACLIPSAPQDALALVFEGVPRPIDAGRVNGHYFLNVATGGFGTDITVNTAPELKKVLGGAAYLLTGISQASNISARRAVIEGPEFSWSGGFLALAVGNGRYAGGGVPMCENALLDNGKFELSILPEVTRDDIPAVLGRLVEHGFSAEMVETHIIRAQAHEFSVSSATPLQINLDGEPLESNRFDFEVLEAALLLHLPAGSPVLSASIP